MRADLLSRWVHYSTVNAPVPWHLFKYRPTYDYVGPESNKSLRRCVPNTIYGVDINYAGFVHDRLYEIGGIEDERRQADWEFWRVINVTLRQNLTGYLWILRGPAFIRSFWYWWAVSALGRSSFNYTLEG